MEEIIDEAYEEIQNEDSPHLYSPLSRCIINQSMSDNNYALNILSEEKEFCVCCFKLNINTSLGATNQILESDINLAYDERKVLTTINDLSKKIVSLLELQAPKSSTCIIVLNPKFKSNLN